MTRAMPANVCATPIVSPSSSLFDTRDISAVVAGKRSAVPTGTSGITTASMPSVEGNG